jgi:hypothetical protein
LKKIEWRYGQPRRKMNHDRIQLKIRVFEEKVFETKGRSFRLNYLPLHNFLNAGYYTVRTLTCEYMHPNSIGL